MAATATAKTRKKGSADETDYGRFRYEGYDLNTGEAVAGYISALDQADARTQLRTKNIVPEVLTESEAIGKFLASDISLGGKKVKQKEIAVFARNLAVTEASGLSTFRAIGMIARQQPEGSQLGLVLRDIHRRMANGQDIADAFAVHEDTFGPLTTALLAAGVSAGRLDKTLLRLADMLERQHKLKSKVRSAMVYPTAIFTFATLALIGALVFVIPTFEDVYKDFGGQLPALTRYLLAVSAVLQSWWFLLPGVPFAARYLIKWVRRHPEHGEKFDAYLLKVPIFGRILHNSITARVADIMAVMLEAQVPSVRAIALARDAANNKAVAAALDRARDRHKSGKALSEALENEPTIPEILPALVKQGEDTLNPEELLARYSEMTESEVEAQVMAMTDLLQPFVLIFLAVLIGVVAIGVYLPILSLYDFFS